MNSNQKQKIDNFEYAFRLRDFEINQLTQRNNFFMIFQGVLFAGLIQSAHTKPVVSFMVCVTGFIVALFQVGMASGAKFWQEYWEQKLSEYEKEKRASEAELFHENDNEYEETVKNRMKKRGLDRIVSFFIMRRYSVSRIPIYTAISFMVVWFLLIMCTLREYPPLSIPSFIVGF